LEQLNVETGVPIGDIEPAVIALIAFNLVAALLPASGRFEEEEDDTRQAGSLQDPRISLASNPKKFLGVSGFGFTKVCTQQAVLQAARRLHLDDVIAELSPLSEFACCQRDQHLHALLQAATCKSKQQSQGSSQLHARAHV
jgi:hypothetical protein